MEHTLRFIELVNGPTTAIDLTDGWLLLDAHAAPDVDLDAQRARVDRLAEACPEPTLDGVRRGLFDQAGFAGANRSYYDPANSLLHTVLDRRRGLPISLSVLMIEVGRRLGVPMDGVGMPGHFLVRDRVLPDVFVDPFASGMMLDAGRCERLFRRLAGPSEPFDPRYLEPVTPVVILARMVANLVNAYRRADDRRNLRWAARLRARCPGVSPQEHYELGLSLIACGALDEGAAVIDDAAAHVDEATARAWRRHAARHRARLN